MRTQWIVFGLSGALLALTSWWLASWSGLPGGALQLTGMLLADARPTDHLVLIITLLSAVAALVLAATHRRSQADGVAPEALKILSWSTPGVGLAAAAWSGYTILLAMIATDTHDLKVIGPSLAQTLLVLSLTILTGGLAAWLGGRTATAAETA